MRSSIFAVSVVLAMGSGCAASGVSEDTVNTSIAIDAPAPAPALADNATITRIAFGSCGDEEKPQPIWHAIGAENPDLFLFTGDNVYADFNHGERVSNPGAADIAYSWNTLAKLKDFSDFYATVPMMVTWDDHDFGKNDAGREFAQKAVARDLMLDFFSIESDDVGKDGEGVYNSRIIGEEGKRVQIIMLDTRSFRGPLKRTDEFGAKGKERYVQSDAPDQDMLGDDQWAWFETELQKDADLRLVVTSIQLVADTHGWEAWRTLPAERDRFYNTLSGAKGGRAVVISGDRHVGGIYRDVDNADYPIYEITSSSLNLSFNPETAVSNELDPRLIGRLYGPENYGLVDIDWEASLLTMSLKSLGGKTVRSVTIPFGEISTGTETRDQ